jgi:hypothetical protein
VKIPIEEIERYLSEVKKDVAKTGDALYVGSAKSYQWLSVCERAAG